MVEKSTEFSKLKEYLESLGKQWGDVLQFYGFLHTATPGKSSLEANLIARQKLVDKFEETVVQEALRAWEASRS